LIAIRINRQKQQSKTDIEKKETKSRMQIKETNRNDNTYGQFRKLNRKKATQ
jgi:hypothetical protein